MPYHPNVVNLLGVTDSGGGKIDGIVKSFVCGTMLKEIKSVRAAQKIKWKKDISDAVHFMHRNELVWGDAASQNVLIDQVKDRAALIDFGGGITKGWTDDNLYET